MVTPPDPEPNYAKFTDELVSKELEGYRVSMEIFPSSVVKPPDPAANVEKGRIPDAVVLHEAYYFFGTFKRLFADLILSIQDKDASLSFFQRLSWDKAFGIVEVELGLVYDLFYTKAIILYTPLGFYLRLLTFLCTVVSLIAFVFIHLKVYPKFKVHVQDHHVVSLKTEVIITYVLLAGAVLLEIYAFLVVLSSDRMMIWLSGDWANVCTLLKIFKKPIFLMICKTVSVLRFLHIVPANRRWFNEMGQHNVLNCCFETQPKCAKLHDYLEKKYFFWKSTVIPKGLKALIFDEVKNRANSNDKELGNYWEDKILVQEMNNFGEDEDHEVEFDQSLLLWHMATDFCYYKDENHILDDKWLHEVIPNNENPHSGDNLKFKREICKLLSDYMMHLLIMSPFMLPSGIGQIRLQDTRAEASAFFEEVKLSEVEACKMLREVDTRLAPSKVKGDRSKSILYDACRLAESLEKQEAEKWDTITRAWLDILTFAAAQCSWSDHAEKLSQGGELMTHVWLLMAHFGMTNQFQISRGYIRAKLNSK